MHTYIWLRVESVVFWVQVQVLPEALLGGGVKHSVLDGSCVGTPDHEQQFRNEHVVCIGELEVEHTISVLFVGQFLNELVPVTLLSADLVDDLHENQVTIFSASIL